MLILRPPPPVPAILPPPSTPADGHPDGTVALVGSVPHDSAPTTEGAAPAGPTDPSHPPDASGAPATEQAAAAAHSTLLDSGLFAGAVLTDPTEEAARAAAAAEVQAQQEAAMAALDAKLAGSGAQVSEAPPVSQFNISDYAAKAVSFLARNFYTLKYVALVLAFCINFVLLFYKVCNVNQNRTWHLLHTNGCIH